LFHASPMIAAAPWAPESLVVDAVRCWREAIDRQRPVLPTLFARLETHHAGFLAPAIAALLAIHEAWLGQRFRAGEPARADLTEDERRLFTLLETNALPAREKAANPGLAGPLHVALRSTRILIRRVLGRDIGHFSPSACHAPIFLASPERAKGNARTSCGGAADQAFA